MTHSHVTPTGSSSQDKATEMGWMDGILNIITNPEGPEGEEEEGNLIDNYGMITLEQVVELEGRYIAERERKGKDTNMLYQCLFMASQSREAKKKKVIIWADPYQIEVDGAKYSTRGVALLKIIICKSNLDTNATTNQICAKLSALNTYISTMDSNIAKSKYNAMVEEGTWNAPTAEEKIVALEAKLTSSTKNLNKKVSFETSKEGSGKAKSTGDKRNKK